MDGRNLTEIKTYKIQEHNINKFIWFPLLLEGMLSVSSEISKLYCSLEEENSCVIPCQKKKYWGWAQIFCSWETLCRQLCYGPTWKLKKGRPWDPKRVWSFFCQAPFFSQGRLICVMIGSLERKWSILLPFNLWSLPGML